MARYQQAGLQQATSLSALNLGQNLIFSGALTVSWLGFENLPQRGPEGRQGARGVWKASSSSRVPPALLATVGTGMISVAQAVMLKKANALSPVTT